jgi:hypothetical protein
MTRLRHAHARVRLDFTERKPGPAVRLTALVTALTLATTLLTPLPASAAPAPATPHGRTSPTPAANRPSTSGNAALNARSASAPLPPPAHHPGSTAAPDKGALPREEQRPPTPLTPTSGAPLASNAPTAPADAAAPTGPDEEATLVSAEDVAALPESLRLEQQFAESALRGYGIRWRSTGGCSDRTVRTCTSFEGLRWGTVKGLIGFAKSSGCKITITGGTERGHAPGTYSHSNGYKLDIAPGRCVDAAIKRYPSTGVRGDGARLYRSPDGTVFAREKDHWDITFR